MKWTHVPSLSDPLDEQIRGIERGFPPDVLEQAEGVLLTGSASRGEATYRSDLDLLVVLRQPPLSYERVVALRRRIEEAMPEGALERPLAADIHFILPSAFATEEKAMSAALNNAVILLDPMGRLAALRGSREGK